MKNDISHHGILLNPIFARFYRILPEIPDFGSGKPDTRSRNLFVLKHIWVKVSITWKFQPNWSKNTLKSGFFRISGKSGSRIRNFFGLKPSRDQDGANKKKFSQIGPAVPEEIGRKQTNTQTSCCYIIEIATAYLKCTKYILKKSVWVSNLSYQNLLPKPVNRLHKIRCVPSLNCLFWCLLLICWMDWALFYILFLFNHWMDTSKFWDILIYISLVASPLHM